MLEFSIVSVSAFVAILDETVKMIAKALDKNVDKYIPIFSLVFGVILGIVGYLLPGLEFGNNIVEAIIIGLSAGGASTGCHQVYKQFTRTNEGIIKVEAVDVDEIIEKEDD